MFYRIKDNTKESNNMKTILFTIENQTYAIHLEIRKTRSGFAHDSYLLKQSNQLKDSFDLHGKSQSCFYINRTWESYTFQSVIHKLINANFEESKAQSILLDIENRKYL